MKKKFIFLILFLLLIGSSIYLVNNYNISQKNTVSIKDNDYITIVPKNGKLTFTPNDTIKFYVVSTSFNIDIKCDDNNSFKFKDSILTIDTSYNCKEYLITCDGHSTTIKLNF